MFPKEIYSEIKFGMRKLGIITSHPDKGYVVQTMVSSTPNKSMDGVAL